MWHCWWRHRSLQHRHDMAIILWSCALSEDRWWWRSCWGQGQGHWTTRQMEIIAPSWFDVFSCRVADMIWCDMKRKICNSWIIVGLEPELVWLPPLPVDRRRCHWPIQKPLIVYIVNHIRSNNFLSIGLVFYLSPVLSFTLNANECMMWGMGLPWWGSTAAATDKRREWWGSLTLCGNFIRIYCPLWFFCRVYWKYLWVR